MANMSYCRFRNTKMDLDDCLESLYNEEELSEEEYDACNRMFTSFFDFLYQQGIIDEEFNELNTRLEDYLNEVKKNIGL